MPLPMQTFRRSMTITHAEFLRSLQPLERHYGVNYENSPQIVIVDRSGRDRWGRVRTGHDRSGRGQSGEVTRGEVHITLGPQGTRRLGRLKLPATDVELRIHGFTATELALFWTRFELSFRRGGG
jgi:hypothetical protein